MRKIIPVVILFTAMGTAHARADMNSDNDAWDTFVNTNEILSRTRQMQHEMRMMLEEQRRQQRMQAAPAPVYVPPSAYELDLERQARNREAPSLRDFELDKDGRYAGPCVHCAPPPSGETTDTGEVWGFKPRNKE